MNIAGMRGLFKVQNLKKMILKLSRIISVVLPLLISVRTFGLNNIISSPKLVAGLTNLLSLLKWLSGLIGSKVSGKRKEKSAMKLPPNSHSK